MPFTYTRFALSLPLFGLRWLFCRWRVAKCFGYNIYRSWSLFTQYQWGVFYRIHVHSDYCKFIIFRHGIHVFPLCIHSFLYSYFFCNFSVPFTFTCFFSGFSFRYKCQVDAKNKYCFFHVHLTKFPFPFSVYIFRWVQSLNWEDPIKPIT